uniref:Putative mytimacin-5 n=1 Tax=Pinctada fucata TaxID=50426 RepID=A0A194AKM8_PINFU
MQSKYIVVVLLFMVMCPYVNAWWSKTASRCFDVWSRCSGWSSAATGYLWLSCNKCCQCKGKSGGRCVSVAARGCPLSKNAYQCQCNGSSLRGGKPGFCGGKANYLFSCDNKN